MRKSRAGYDSGQVPLRIFDKCFAEGKKISSTARHSVELTFIWDEDKMKKMKLSLASLILKPKYYEKKCLNVT